VCKGYGIIIVAGGSEVATYTREGIGRIRLLGGASYRGSVFLRAVFLRASSSSGKLSFLNRVDGLLESEIDAEGNFSYTYHQWHLEKSSKISSILVSTNQVFRSIFV
jgi:hypothetical protein